MIPGFKRKTTSNFESNNKVKTNKISESQNDISTKVLLVPFMENGLNYKVNQIPSNITFVTSTCAFDTLYHIVGTAALNSDSYRSYLKSLNNDILNFIVQIIEKRKINQYSDIFKGRSDLLIKKDLIAVTNETIRNLTMGREKKNKKIVNGECNIVSIIMKAFVNGPSMQRLQSCELCTSEGVALEKECTFKINANKLTNKEFKNFQSLIDDEFATRLKCVNCVRLGLENSKANSEFKLFEHLIIQTHENVSEDIALSSITLSINTFDDEYIIVGLGSFKNKHYVAYCYIKKNWVEFNDMRKKAVYVKNAVNTFVSPHLLFYMKKSYFES